MGIRVRVIVTSSATRYLGILLTRRQIKPLIRWTPNRYRGDVGELDMDRLNPGLTALDSARWAWALPCASCSEWVKLRSGRGGGTCWAPLPNKSRPAPLL